MKAEIDVLSETVNSLQQELLLVHKKVSCYTYLSTKVCSHSQSLQNYDVMTIICTIMYSLIHDYTVTQ